MDVELFYYYKETIITKFILCKKAKFSKQAISSIESVGIENNSKNPLQTHVVVQRQLGCSFSLDTYWLQDLRKAA